MFWLPVGERDFPFS